MSNLLSVYNRQGFVGFCSARCYNARLPSTLSDTSHTSREPCDCVCGGANHAAGFERAFKNVTQGVGFRPGDLEHFARTHGLRVEDLVVVDRTRYKTERARRIAKVQLEERDNLHPITELPLFSCEAVS
jgi:hypothetical protein